MEPVELMLLFLAWLKPIGSKRIEFAGPFPTACGFDNPQQFWEDCLIHYEQLTRGSLLTQWSHAPYHRRIDNG
jgi:hypothetical protein